MPDKSITLLHISDMQFGRNHQFGNLAAGDLDAKEDTLLARLARTLQGLAEEGMRPQVIIVSGDLAEQARPQEFLDARNFLTKLSERLSVPRSHVVIVPGNHDVNWQMCRSHFEERAAHERQEQPPYWPKWQFYVSMFKRFYAGHPQVRFTSRQPWTFWTMPDLKMAVVGLNSTLKESHQKGDHYGYVGEEQMRSAVEFLEPHEQNGWFRLGVIHHNTLRGATNDSENLRDSADLGRILGPHLHLLLHGHTHYSELSYLGEGLPVLSTGSAGLNREARPDDVPNQFQTIRLSRNEIERWTLFYNAREKVWEADVRGSRDGKSWKRTHEANFRDAQAALGSARSVPPRTAAPRAARRAGSRATNSAGTVRTPKGGGALSDTGARKTDRTPPEALGGVAGKIVDSLAESMLTGEDRMLIGKAGSGKTRILETLLDIALANTSLIPIPVRIEAANARPELTLMRALHLRFGGNFMPHDGDEAGLRQLRPIVPNGAVLLVDEADTQAALRGLEAIRNRQIENLTVIAASKLDGLDGVSSAEVVALPEPEARTVLDTFELGDQAVREIVRRSKGQPQQLRQRAAAAAAGRSFDRKNPNEALLRSWSHSPRASRLIALMPSSLLGVELLKEVGKLSEADFSLLELHGAGERVRRGSGMMGTFVAVHPKFVQCCRKSLTGTSDADREMLLASAAKHYCKWIANGPHRESMHAALDNFMFLVEEITDEPLRAQLVIALIGDDLDEPSGYIPSHGLARLLLDDLLQSLETMADSKSVPGEDAGNVLKNLGLLLHRANRPGGEYLLRKAIGRYSEGQDERGIAATTFILGEVAENAGAYDDAIELFREPRKTCRDAEILALSHYLEGCAHYRWEKYDDARRSLKAAKATGELSPVFKLRINRALAYVDLATGKAERTAARRLIELRKRAEQLDRPREAARCSRHIGQAQLKLKQVGSALNSLQRAEGEFRRLGDRRGLGATLRVRAAATGSEAERRLDARTHALESRRIACGKESEAGSEPGPPRVRSAIGLARANEELANIEELARPGTDVPPERQAQAEALRRSACNIYEAIGHPRAEVLENWLKDRDAAFPSPVRGVIFDLVDTLAYLNSAIYERSKTSISQAMEVDHKLFKAAWAKSRKKASMQLNWAPHERIEWVAERLGKRLAKPKLKKLAALERDLWTKSTELDPSAKRVLKTLKESGIRVTLATNGSSAMKELPRQLGIDEDLYATPLLSCEVGQMKPGPLIYERALDGLGLKPAQCIYVGDGSDRELEGAQDVGLFAVRLTAHRRGRPKYRTSDSLDWDATVASLDELPERIGIPEPEA